MRLELVSVLLCSLAPLTVAEGICPCPTGFVQYQQACYWFSNIAGSFAEARSYCQFFRSHLARITSKEEDDFVRSYAKETGRAPDYWLGATDLITERTFVWEVGDTLNYTNWHSDEPNKKTENCLGYKQLYDYLWNDYRCDVAINFICERKVPRCC
ncbi:perlucin-like [Haliotis rufescens]|uniref:perlucin-like n=1 Tax=Haliotis rufescens TaxID=6454 RepID=UPI00201F0880|nr:perlucin-like [Haliotis rufescens]